MAGGFANTVAMRNRRNRNTQRKKAAAPVTKMGDSVNVPVHTPADSQSGAGLLRLRSYLWRWSANLTSAVNQLRAGLVWLHSYLWQWTAILLIATLVYGFGVSAMYGNQYVAACVLFFVAITVVTARAIAATKKQEQRAGVIVIVVVVAVVISALSLGWVLYTKFQVDNPTNQAIMEITNMDFSAETALPFQPSQPIFINLFFRNGGKMPAHNVIIHSRVTFVAVPNGLEEHEKEIDRLFKQLYKEFNDFLETGRKGFVLSQGERQFTTSFLESPSREDIEAFNERRAAVCVIARVEYDDIHWYERCAYFMIENLAQLKAEERMHWTFCSSHNDFGTHLKV